MVGFRPLRRLLRSTTTTSLIPVPFDFFTRSVLSDAFSGLTDDEVELPQGREFLT